jgi:phosphoribosylanthranilate isomerase
MFLKVCGITRRDDALHAVEQGATAIGFVLWPRSPRYIAPERVADIVAALPPGVVTVGVFVNDPVDHVRATMERAGLTTVQLHGDEPPTFAERLAWPVVRAVRVDAVDSCGWPAETTLLLDAIDGATRGGTGQTIDWPQAADVARRRRVVLAGGLTAANVGEAIDRVRPFGVDVSSGVESAPGIKDLEQVARFLANARSAFAAQGEGVREKWEGGRRK